MLYKRVRYFLEAANCLNFSTAAKNMFISQQAMTWHIACLEEELGVKLFVRSTRSVNLTEAGKRCRDEYTRINKLLDEAVVKIRNAALVSTATITIGFTNFLSRPAIISPLMESLREAFPDVNFDMRLYPFSEIRNMLLDGNLDLCISTSTTWSYWPEVNVHVLRPHQFKVFMSVKHPLARKDTLEMDDLKPYQWIRFNYDDVHRHGADWQDRIVSGRLHVPDLETALAYLESGQGFATLTRVFQGSDSKTLKSFPLPFPEATADLICACRKNMMNPLVLSVTKHIREFAETPGAFEV